MFLFLSEQKGQNLTLVAAFLVLRRDKNVLNSGKKKKSTPQFASAACFEIDLFKRHNQHEAAKGGEVRRQQPL